MKDLSAFSHGEITKLSLDGEEQFDGEACYIIMGYIYEVPWVLWIGKGSHLLRKLRTLYSADSFDEAVEKKGTIKVTIGEEIHRDIRINEKMPKVLFEYKPEILVDDIDLTQKPKPNNRRMQRRPRSKVLMVHRSVRRGPADARR